MKCLYCHKTKFRDQEELARHCSEEEHLDTCLLFHTLCPLCRPPADPVVENIIVHLQNFHSDICSYCMRKPARGYHPECRNLWDDMEDTQMLRLYCGHCHVGPFEDRTYLARHCRLHFSCLEKRNMPDCPECPKCFLVSSDLDEHAHFIQEHFMMCWWCFSWNPILHSKHVECEREWKILKEERRLCVQQQQQQ